MRKIAIHSAIVLAYIFCCREAFAQSFLDRMKQKAKDKINQRADSKADKTMDKALDERDSVKTNGKSSEPASQPRTTSPTPATTFAVYKNYDFVPGDDIIFESNLVDEATAEIPSQFVLNRGQADIQTEDGENVIHFPKGANASITPRLANGMKLPDAYTIEFDFKDELYGVNHINVDFGYRVGSYADEHLAQGIGFQDRFANWKHGDISYPEDLVAATKAPMVWHHYAVVINKETAKAYIDQYRVISLNDLTGDHSHMNIEMVAYENGFLKNVRIAAGGMDLYKKVTAEKKIIAHGILFDVDKATLKPQSMGTINRICALLQKDMSLRFEIGGHTDNTGNAAHNLSLSQSRAEAVKFQLVSMGIDASRLTTKGYGDTKPLGSNDTPEGKGNNRRVEFAKL